MNITLGSMSAHKLEAVRLACEKIGLKATITGVETDSTQNEQPVGFEETYAGALARARAVQKSDSGTAAIGIESGIMRFTHNTPITLDIAVIVILLPDGHKIISSSPGVQFPEECVQIAQTQGFETLTVGSVIAGRYGGDATDPHAILTKGKVRRMDTLIDALVVALKQI